MTIIFKAKSQEAYVIKILSELLVNNLKLGCFEIDENGIVLRMMDSGMKILINLVLNSKNQGFTLFKFNNPKKLFLGINLSHLYKLIKSIKKKDSIELFIDDESPLDLSIKIIPKEHNKSSLANVKIQSYQNIDIDIPLSNSRPISIPASDFQKLIKELNNISKTIRIKAKNSYIKFESDADGVYNKYFDFGEDDELEEIIYDEDFSTEQLTKITKFAGLSNIIQVFPGYPLLFKSNVGTLGIIEVFIKSKKELEKQRIENENDDDDSYDSE